MYYLLYLPVKATKLVRDDPGRSVKQTFRPLDIHFSPPEQDLLSLELVEEWDSLGVPLDDFSVLSAASGMLLSQRNMLEIGFVLTVL